jgi:hypothetical protein
VTLAQPTAVARRGFPARRRVECDIPPVERRASEFLSFSSMG